MLIVLAAAGLLLAQSAASAPPIQAMPAADAPAAKPKKPKRICESITTTESIIPKQVCRTPEQEKAYREAEAKRTDSAQALLRNCQGPGC